MRDILKRLWENFKALLILAALILLGGVLYSALNLLKSSL